jgi:hypothetical protein
MLRVKGSVNSIPYCLTCPFEGQTCTHVTCACVSMYVHVQMAVDQRAVFVVSPCCVGEWRLSATHSLT